VLLIAVVIILLLTGAFGTGSDKPEPDAEPEPVVTVAPNTPDTPKPQPNEDEDPDDSAERSKSTPAPESEFEFEGLAGRWELHSGVLVWFFGTSEYIEFEVHGDGTGIVFESEEEESGKWHIDKDGYFIVEADWSGTYTFEFILTEDTLTIIDEDGDTTKYIRAE